MLPAMKSAWRTSAAQSHVTELTKSGTSNWLSWGTKAVTRSAYLQRSLCTPLYGTERSANSQLLLSLSGELPVHDTRTHPPQFAVLVSFHLPCLLPSHSLCPPSSITLSPCTSLLYSSHSLEKKNSTTTERYVIFFLSLNILLKGLCPGEGLLRGIQHALRRWWFTATGL